MLKYMAIATFVIGAATGMATASILVGTDYADSYRLLDIACCLVVMGIASVGIGVFREIRKAGY